MSTRDVNCKPIVYSGDCGASSDHGLVIPIMRVTSRTDILLGMGHTEYTSH